MPVMSFKCRGGTWDVNTQSQHNVLSDKLQHKVLEAAEKP